MSNIEGARLFRETWIAGVKKHYPGVPKQSYVTPCFRSACTVSVLRGRFCRGWPSGDAVR